MSDEGCGMVGVLIVTGVKGVFGCGGTEAVHTKAGNVDSGAVTSRAEWNGRPLTRV